IFIKVFFLIFNLIYDFNMILAILILKRTGENICSRTYGTTKWNETLTSGFISATFDFTQKTFGTEIQDIELGPYRILFELTDDFIIVAFYEKSDSIINIQNKLIDLKQTIYSKYKKVLNDITWCVEDFKGLGDIVDEIISGYYDIDIRKDLIRQYKDILENFRSNAEILYCDLISSSGVPLTKEWNKEFLDLCLRMIDAFWKSQHYVLDQIILSYEQRTLILHKVNDNFVLSALIRRNTPIGMATYLVEETSNNISKLS
ncbi:MAG: hypothetical protein ACFFG0_37065, partial [Candidatus Thorarchaeota archaeon]